MTATPGIQGLASRDTNLFAATIGPGETVHQRSFPSSASGVGRHVVGRVLQAQSAPPPPPQRLTDHGWMVMDEVVYIRNERNAAGNFKVFVLAVQASIGQQSSVPGNRTTM